MLDKLKIYHVMAWPLFPCSAKTKAPLTEHGFKDASIDWPTIEAWQRQFPGCAWGVATSAERGVIDIDLRHNGDNSLSALIAKHGPLPETPRVKTGSGGYHYWFRFPPETPTTLGTIGEGIDRIASTGYVIVPPSAIAIPDHQGRAYAWEIRPWEIPLAEAPAWAIGTSKGQSQGQRTSPEASGNTDAFNPWIVQADGDDLVSHPGSPEGQRRKTLCRLVGIHLARGDSDASIKALAEGWAKRCNPPFADWQRHYDGLLAKEEAKSMTAQSPPYRLRIDVQEDKSDGLLPGKENNPPASGVDEGIYFPSLAGPEDDKVLSAEWPTLSPEAEYGILGKMLKAVKPETEADAPGILFSWLAIVGNIVGRGAWASVGPRQHCPISPLKKAS